MAQDIAAADVVDLEHALIVLERLGEVGPELAAVARRATAAILAVVDIVSPAEVEVAWDGTA